MIVFRGLCVNHIVCASVISSLLCVATAADRHGFTSAYLDQAQTLLKLSCDWRVLATPDTNLSLVIYDLSSMAALAEMRVGECPRFSDSALTSRTYVLACRPSDHNPVLEIILTDVQSSPSSTTFGCNITRADNTSVSHLVTWTTTAQKTDLTVAMDQRTAESRLQPLDKPAHPGDSNYSVYAMGFAILSLCLGLASALFYIGMHALKSRRRSVGMTGGGRSERPEGDTEAYEEEIVGDSGSGPDNVGCERTLICPNGAFRRPSYQDFSEPLSPTPSAVSDYSGIDFLQIQLSDTQLPSPDLKLPRSNSTRPKQSRSNSLSFGKASDSSQRVLWDDKVFIQIDDTLTGKGCREIKTGCLKSGILPRGCAKRLLDNSCVVIEFTTTEILECSDHMMASLRSYIGESGARSWESGPYKVTGVVGHL